MKTRQETGCTGLGFVLLAMAYLAAFKFGGIEAYVYLGVSILAIMGLICLAFAALTD